ncbi:hypothetical protein [Pseudoalteromonas sp. L1]|uniref:hypothetical protein n=1 Tax=Pseudoalteromonas sp. L1 TaxID=195716 RepID=UPI001F487F26|nr:hypothetical protein [Pseudoalteromonas sp. L1]
MKKINPNKISSAPKKAENNFRLTVSRKNIVLKGNEGRFKRGPYRGASLLFGPEEIQALYEMGKVVVPFVTGVWINNRLVNKGAKASRGTTKLCSFKLPSRQRVCRKHLYYRETIICEHGKKYDVFRCDDGHELKQAIISCKK